MMFRLKKYLLILCLVIASLFLLGGCSRIYPVRNLPSLQKFEDDILIAYPYVQDIKVSAAKAWKCLFEIYIADATDVDEASIKLLMTECQDFVSGEVFQAEFLEKYWRVTDFTIQIKSISQPSPGEYDFIYSTSASYQSTRVDPDTGRYEEYIDNYQTWRKDS